jgi:hypothetical protein
MVLFHIFELVLKTFKNLYLDKDDHIVGVMVSVLVSSAVDHGFEPHSGQTKDYKIDICCFFGKHAALRSKILVCSESGECVRVEGHNITRTGFENIICHTRCEYANNYTIEAMQDIIEEQKQHRAPV